jgi:hypothetical protein
MVACIDFFEMSEICRPKFIVCHSTYLPTYIIFMLKDFENGGDVSIGLRIAKFALRWLAACHYLQNIITEPKK